MSQNFMPKSYTNATKAQSEVYFINNFIEKIMSQNLMPKSYTNA